MTKHETIKTRMKELVQMKIPSNKQDKDEYCMDLAYAVREASLFRITGSDVDKGKKLLDQLIGKRCNVVSCHFVNIARLWKVLSGCQEDLLGKILYLVWFIDLVFYLLILSLSFRRTHGPGNEKNVERSNPNEKFEQIEKRDRSM